MEIVAVMVRLNGKIGKRGYVGKYVHAEKQHLFYNVKYDDIDKDLLKSVNVSDEEYVRSLVADMNEAPVTGFKGWKTYYESILKKKPKNL